MGDVSGPIDGAILEDFRDRARTHELVESVHTERTGGTPSMLVVEFDPDRYPSHVTEATLEIQWYRNDDYNLHYVETHTPDGVWQCRWDRHPNPHTSRTHVHPPPGARSSDAVSDDPDECYPAYIFTRTLANVRDRIDDLWERRS